MQINTVAAAAADFLLVFLSIHSRSNITQWHTYI